MTVLTPAPGVVLRDIEPADVETLRTIHAEPDVARWWLGAPAPEWPPLGDDGATVHFTVEVDGAAAGQAEYHIYQPLDEDCPYAGIDLFIATGLHGQGIGTIVVRELARHLTEDVGFNRLIIDPNKTNERAIACYSKVGFQPVGVMREYCREPDGSWSDSLLMELLARELAPAPARKTT